MMKNRYLFEINYTIPFKSTILGYAKFGKAFSFIYLNSLCVYLCHEWDPHAQERISTAESFMLDACGLASILYMLFF
jgi:hypothetical protein